MERVEEGRDSTYRAECAEGRDRVGQGVEKKNRSGVGQGAEGRNEMGHVRIDKTHGTLEILTDELQQCVKLTACRVFVVFVNGLTSAIVSIMDVTSCDAKL